MVMAYLPGGTLSRRIAGAPDGLPLADSICITSQVASALDYAHAQGIVHRDVKPGNIMLDARGNAYLGDFGIAQTPGAGSPAPLGTFAYMAPELLAGEKASPASDVYSLGVVAFEMLSGSRPYEAHDRASLLDLRARIGIPDILDLRPDLPPGMQVVLAQALAEDPSGRPPHASSLAAALHRASGLTDLPCAGLDKKAARKSGAVQPAEEDDETVDAMTAIRLPVIEEDDPATPDDVDDLEDEDLELDDHPLVRTPPPFAELSYTPPAADTQPGKSADGKDRLESPPTKVSVPAAIPAPERSEPRSIGPLLALIWLGAILGLLGLAVLAVVVISRSG
jgi:serine/threonine protein kinase